MINEIKPLAFGIAAGIVWGLCVFFVGLMAAYANMAVALVDTLGSAYPGYAPTLAGSVIGFVWAFIDAFILAFVAAWIYNLLVKKLYTGVKNR